MAANGYIAKRTQIACGTDRAIRQGAAGRNDDRGGASRIF
jgi:hypothetical protein